MATRIKRLSGMISGYYSVLIINGKPEYRKVNEVGGRCYIKQDNQRIFESQLPIGEEVVL
jgi:hypothetical protein